jgi:hypothetical protein
MPLSMSAYLEASCKHQHSTAFEVSAVHLSTNHAEKHNTSDCTVQHCLGQCVKVSIVEGPQAAVQAGEHTLWVPGSDWSQLLYKHPRGQRVAMRITKHASRSAAASGLCSAVDTQSTVYAGCLCHCVKCPPAAAWLLRCCRARLRQIQTEEKAGPSCKSGTRACMTRST